MNCTGWASSMDFHPGYFDCLPSDYNPSPFSYDDKMICS
jgi:hypothetical protein